MQDNLDATEDVALNFGDEEEVFSRRKKFRFPRCFWFVGFFGALLWLNHFPGIILHGIHINQSFRAEFYHLFFLFITMFCWSRCILYVWTIRTWRNTRTSTFALPGLIKIREGDLFTSFNNKSVQLLTLLFYKVHKKNSGSEE